MIPPLPNDEQTRRLWDGVLEHLKDHNEPGYDPNRAMKALAAAAGVTEEQAWMFAHTIANGDSSRIHYALISTVAAAMERTPPWRLN